MKKAFKIIIAIILLINLSACSNTNKSSQELETTVTIQLSDTSEPSQWIRQADSIKIIDYSETVQEDALYDVSIVISESYTDNASYVIDKIYSDVKELISSIQNCKSINSLSVSFVNDDNNSDVFMSFEVKGENICKINADKISRDNYILQKQAEKFFIRKVNIYEDSFYPSDFLSEYEDIDEYIVDQLTQYFSDYFENVQVDQAKKKEVFYVKAYVPQTKDELISDWDTFLETSSYSYKAYNSIIADMSKYKLDFTVYSTDEVRLYNTVVDEMGKKFVYDAQKKPVTNSSSTSITVYITPTGSKYHFDSHCNGGSYSATTLESAKNSGYTPCGKCVG